jgi:stress response protein SCP2
MTFIVAVQLKDSIVVAVDNKYLTLENKELDHFEEHISSKLYTWHSGIITGTGEHYVIDKAVRLFINNVDSNIEKLPTCLNISRQIREMEVGQHEQIQSSKLLYSEYSENGAKLFAIEPTKELGKYQTTEFKENDLIIWLFNPNIQSISENLKTLYSNPRPKTSFNRIEDWLDYYISTIAEIYAKQSCVDTWMSSSLDIFFQTKDQYFYKHIQNNQTLHLK